MTFLKTLLLVTIGAAFTAFRPVSNSHARVTEPATRLLAIVGEWQTDTVSGFSARSSCVWTPQRGGVMCDQRISSAAGTSSALNLFVPDTASGAFVLYVLSHPGSDLTPVPLAIKGTEWVYGGAKAANDGMFYRTVNDFSNTDSYDWRQEMSKNGTDWTPGIHGHVRRVQ